METHGQSIYQWAAGMIPTTLESCLTLSTNHFLLFWAVIPPGSDPYLWESPSSRLEPSPVPTKKTHQSPVFKSLVRPVECSPEEPLYKVWSYRTFRILSDAAIVDPHTTAFAIFCRVLEDTENEVRGCSHWSPAEESLRFFLRVNPEVKDFGANKKRTQQKPVSVSFN